MIVRESATVASATLALPTMTLETGWSSFRTFAWLRNTRIMPCSSSAARLQAGRDSNAAAAHALTHIAWSDVRTAAAMRMSVLPGGLAERNVDENDERRLKLCWFWAACR
jgi:hypothetical protein